MDVISQEQHSSKPKPCTCRRVRKHLGAWSFGPLTTRRRATTEHVPDCPFHSVSRTTDLQIQFRAVLSRCISRSLEIMFSTKSGVGGQSMSASWTAICIVNGRNGPGFARFTDARRSLREIVNEPPNLWVDATRSSCTSQVLQRVRRVLKELHDNIARDLSGGALLANVQSETFQETLLFVSILLTSPRSGIRPEKSFFDSHRSL